LLISEVGETVREYVLWFQSYCERTIGKAGSKERNDDRVFDWQPTQRSSAQCLRESSRVPCAEGRQRRLKSCPNPVPVAPAATPISCNTLTASWPPIRRVKENLPNAARSGEESGIGSSAPRGTHVSSTQRAKGCRGNGLGLSVYGPRVIEGSALRFACRADRPRKSGC
jgi:hypothetical protein